MLQPYCTKKSKILHLKNYLKWIKIISILILTFQSIAYAQTISTHPTLKHDILISSPEQDYARGLKYIDGEKFDADEAFKWIASAAEQNHTEAMHLLGIMYFNGIGTNFNLNQAIYWVGKAATKNDLKAVQRLAALMEFKIYANEDELKQLDTHTRLAISHIVNRAIIGDKNAQQELALLYNSEEMSDFSKVFIPNKSRSNYWIKKSSEKNYSSRWLNEAQYQYSVFQVFHSVKSLEKAIKWTKIGIKGKHYQEPYELLHIQQAREQLPQLEEELKRANTQRTESNK